MKAKTIEQQIEDCRRSIIIEVQNWKSINSKGCQDPFWTDGVNMNLLRNHVIYYKKQLTDLCVQNGLPLPEEYYIPTPPVVSDKYMATYKQKERVNRLKEQGNELTRRKTEYDTEQTSLF